ncbi:transmembrane protein, putative, partial [Bodo saltans]
MSAFEEDPNNSAEPHCKRDDNETIEMNEPIQHLDNGESRDVSALIRNPTTTSPIKIIEVTTMTKQDSAAVSANKDSFATALVRSFSEIPQHLHSMVKRLHKLNSEDLVAIYEHTNMMTLKHVFGAYDSSAWYVPDVTVANVTEPQWGWKADLARGGAVVTIFGRIIRLNLAWWTFLAALLVLGWYTLYNILGSKLMTRGGYVWDPVVAIIVASVVGGTVCRFFQMPALLGILWVGIMWHNIPYVGYLTSGIYSDVTTIVQRFGLTVVLLRAGFSLSISIMRPHLLESALLCTIPFSCEAITHAFIANALFHYNSYTWAFLEGCMCAIVSPAIIAVEIIKLQESGLGQGEGSLSLMLSGVSVEVCAGVWATSFIIELLFSTGSIAKSIVLGPVQLIVGAIIGIFVGWMFYRLVALLKAISPRTKTGDIHPKQARKVMKLAYAFMLTMGCGFVFFGNNHDLAGGGAVATVAFAGTIAQLWPAQNATKTQQEERKYMAKCLSLTWDFVAMPALFAIVGTTIGVKDIFNSDFTPKMIGITAAAVAARMIATYAIQWRRPYDWKQKLLVCGGYAGKATAQASLAPLALMKVNALIAASGMTDELQEKQRIAQLVKQAAQFFIICSVPLCTLTINFHFVFFFFCFALFVFFAVCSLVFPVVFVVWPSRFKPAVKRIDNYEAIQSLMVLFFVFFVFTSKK